MKVTISKFDNLSIRRILGFLVLLILSYKLIADALLWNFMSEISGRIVCFLCIIIVAFKTKLSIGKLSHISLINIWLFSVSVAIIIRQDNNWIESLALVIAMFLITRSTFDVFMNFVYASAVAIIPFVLRWLLAVIRLGEYQGNRAPIHFTTVAILIVALMYIKNIQWKWQYIVLTVAAMLDFIGQSRTYLVVCAMAFVLLTFFNFKGKLNYKKLILFMFIILAVSIGIVKMQDQFVELFTNKWYGQTSIFTGRSMMWLDVLSEFKWWGYEEGYILNKYLLNNVHNAFLQAYVSYGAIVGALYILLILFSIARCIKNRNNRLIQGLMIAFIPVTVAGLFESNFIMETEYLYLGICNAYLIGQIFRTSNDITKYGGEICLAKRN